MAVSRTTRLAVSAILVASMRVLPRTAVTDAGFSVVSINKWANINIGTCVERVYGSATAPFVYANLSSDSSGNGYSEVRDTNKSAVSVGISSKTFSGGKRNPRRPLERRGKRYGAWNSRHCFAIELY